MGDVAHRQVPGRHLLGADRQDRGHGHEVLLADLRAFSASSNAFRSETLLTAHPEVMKNFLGTRFIRRVIDFRI